MCPKAQWSYQPIKAFNFGRTIWTYQTAAHWLAIRNFNQTELHHVAVRLNFDESEIYQRFEGLLLILCYIRLDGTIANGIFWTQKHHKQIWCRTIKPERKLFIFLKVSIWLDAGLWRRMWAWALWTSTKERKGERRNQRRREGISRHRRYRRYVDLTRCNR